MKKRWEGEKTDVDGILAALGFVTRKLTDGEQQSVGEIGWCFARSWGGHGCPDDLVVQKGDKWLAYSIFTFDSLHETPLRAAKHLRGVS
jgi:hypothetical protein